MCVAELAGTTGSLELLVGRASTYAERMGQELLEVSVDELDARLGAALRSGALGSKSASPAEQREAGRRWFSSSLPRIQAVVCAHPVVLAHCAQVTVVERTELLAGVREALTGTSEFQIVPRDVLAARLVLFGVERMCASRSSGP